MKTEMTKIETRKSKLARTLSRVSNFAFRVSFSFWRWLRAVLDDDAYDRYATRRSSVIPSEVEGPACLLTASEFYRQRVERKYSRPTRCC